jgi:hypothetical protein
MLWIVGTDRLSISTTRQRTREAIKRVDTEKKKRRKQSGTTPPITAGRPTSEARRNLFASGAVVIPELERRKNARIMPPNPFVGGFLQRGLTRRDNYVVEPLLVLVEDLKCARDDGQVGEVLAGEKLVNLRVGRSAQTRGMQVLSGSFFRRRRFHIRIKLCGVRYLPALIVLVASPHIRKGIRVEVRNRKLGPVALIVKKTQVGDKLTKNFIHVDADRGETRIKIAKVRLVLRHEVIRRERCLGIVKRGGLLRHLRRKGKWFTLETSQNKPC